MEADSLEKRRTSKEASVEVNPFLSPYDTSVDRASGKMCFATAIDAQHLLASDKGKADP